MTVTGKKAQHIKIMQKNTSIVCHYSTNVFPMSKEKNK